MSTQVLSGQTISEFINGTLIGTYKELSKINGYSYITFSLIFSGIELLGKCLDDTHDFEHRNPSGHFDDGLKLFDSKYHSLQLYEFCRCGFAHCVKPTKDSLIVLSQRTNIDINDRYKYPNLCSIEESDKKVLFIEDFYTDFEIVCNKVLKMIENGQLRHPKIKSIFLPVRDVILIP